MKFLNRQNASTLFCYTLLASLCSLLIVGGLAVSTVKTVKIGSELHEQIIEGKDLIADVLPPPAFILEAYQVTGQMLRTTDSTQIDTYSARLQMLEKDFQDRMSFWGKQIEEHAGDSALTSIFETLEKDARKPAEKFFKVAQSELVVALKAGNSEQANKLFEETLTPEFEVHRRAIDVIVKQVNAHNANVEVEVGATVANSSWLLVGAIAAATIIVVVAGAIVYRLIRKAEERNKDFTGRFNAIDRSQAIIEFNLDGTIITANRNFLDVTGYQLEEIKGRHHRMFVSQATATSAEYMQLWADLNAGKYIPGQFQRFHKDGSEIWIQASYNPILDQNGKPFKVIKYASDITASKKMELAIAERQKQDEQAAISMRNRVNEILAVAEKVAKLDYSQELTVKGDDEIGKLGEGLTRFFADKRRVEEAEQARNEREREAAVELERKVALVLNAVSAVADGKFDVTIPDLGSDAIGQVATALRSAVTAMRSALQEVRNVAQTVSTASQQLTAVSREISSGAQSQASSLEETASSLEEITSTVKQNTDNAQQARQLANGSRDVAERGGAVVNDAVLAMEEINNSSKRIADIITTIDEIAFQTNLLALNAAVEAARAGEQGRGFAVVAAEVRNLAQRSASAAKEIKTLIQDSVSKVKNGTELVNRSGQTLGEIVNSVKRVTDIVAEIAAASKEQLTGIEQVNKAVAQMDRVTQGNAAQTEEMSGTANMLLTHAEQLSELVGQFQLESGNEKTRRVRVEEFKATKSAEPEFRPAPVALAAPLADNALLEF